MHLAGVTHRNIKPDNFYFDGRFQVKISDFGFSKSFFRGEGSNKRVKLRTILGTQGYMSPEMLMSMPYDERSDIFSLGCVAFIMVAGYPPLQVAQVGDWWFERLLEGRYAKFWQAHEQGEVRFSRLLKDMISNMLEPNPAERFSILDVLDSDWMKEDVYDVDEYTAKMTELKHMMKLKKEHDAFPGVDDLAV